MVCCVQCHLLSESEPIISMDFTVAGASGWFHLKSGRIDQYVSVDHLRFFQKNYSGYSFYRYKISQRDFPQKNFLHLLLHFEIWPKTRYFLKMAKMVYFKKLITSQLFKLFSWFLFCFVDNEWNFYPICLKSEHAIFSKEKNQFYFAKIWGVFWTSWFFFLYTTKIFLKNQDGNL